MKKIIFLVSMLILSAAIPAAYASAEDFPSFMDCFDPMPIIEPLSHDAWGTDLVGARDQANGLEDKTLSSYSYWDGGIIKDDESGKYYMFASKWDQSKGHNGWKNSVAVCAVSDNLCGPYIEKEGLLWPDNKKGAGHNVFPFKLKENDPHGKYAIINSDNGRPGDIFVSDSLDGPWTFCTSITSNMKGSGFTAVNVAVFLRPDGKYEALGRHGDIAIADDLKGPWQVVVNSLWEQIPNLPYKDSDGGNRLEDPTIWYSNGTYHCIVNHWKSRKAYYMTSPDGITNWQLHSGSAYEPDSSFLRYTDNTVNRWNKIERPYAYVENGVLKAFTFAVIDSPKENDKGNDNHASKVIVVPFNSEKLNEVLKEPYPFFQRQGIVPTADVNIQSWKNEKTLNYGANTQMRMQVNNTNSAFGLFGENISGGTGDDCKISFLTYDIADCDPTDINKATLSLIYKNRRTGDGKTDKIRVALSSGQWSEGSGGDILGKTPCVGDITWANKPSVLYDADNLASTVCTSPEFNTDEEYQVLEIDVTALLKSADISNGKISFALCNTTQGNTLAFLTKELGDKYSALLNIEYSSLHKAKAFVKSITATSATIETQATDYGKYVMITSAYDDNNILKDFSIQTVNILPGTQTHIVDIDARDKNVSVFLWEISRR